MAGRSTKDLMELLIFVVLALALLPIVQQFVANINTSGTVNAHLAIISPLVSLGWLILVVTVVFFTVRR